MLNLQGINKMDEKNNDLTVINASFETKDLFEMKEVNDLVLLGNYP